MSMVPPARSTRVGAEDSIIIELSYFVPGASCFVFGGSPFVAPARNPKYKVQSAKYKVQSCFTSDESSHEFHPSTLSILRWPAARFPVSARARLALLFVTAMFAAANRKQRHRPGR